LKIEEQTVHTTLKISLKKEKFQKNKNHLKTDKITATDIVNVIQLERTTIKMRVRSWLRMNAGGVPNTCKSNEVIAR
jgi:hypothetical protein